MRPSPELRTPWNPCPTAIKRVRDALPIPETCTLCSGPVDIVGNEKIYGRKFGDWPWAIRCRCCRAYVGLHPKTNIPLGTLADQPTRDARKRVKPLFEMLWRHEPGLPAPMTRDQAYAWLSEQTGLPPARTHFGMFSVEDCANAEKVLTRYWEAKLMQEVEDA